SFFLAEQQSPCDTRTRHQHADHHGDDHAEAREFERRHIVVEHRTEEYVDRQVQIHDDDGILADDLKHLFDPVTGQDRAQVYHRHEERYWHDDIHEHIIQPTHLHIHFVGHEAVRIEHDEKCRNERIRQGQPERTVVFDGEILRIIPERIIKDRNQHSVHVPEEVVGRKHRRVTDQEQHQDERHLDLSFERAHETKEKLRHEQHRDEPEHAVRPLEHPAPVEECCDMLEYHAQVM